MNKKRAGLFLGLVLALTLVLSSNTSNLKNYAGKDPGTLPPLRIINLSTDPGTLPPL